MQTVAAIRYVTTGAYLNIIKDYEKMPIAPEFKGLLNRLLNMAEKYEASVNKITELKDQEMLDITARKLVEMAAYIIMGHLLLQDATTDKEMFSSVANVFVRYAEVEVDKHALFVNKFNKDDLAFYRK